ncbi:hypothetical protein AB8Q18_06275 [Neisseriaceae bacterium CLB008]
MTVGAQFFNDNGVVQITDEVESVVFLREDATPKPLGTTNELRVERDSRSFVFGPISMANIPSSGIGLELFNASGKRMFSSLVPPAAIIGMVKTDYRSPVKEVRGNSGRKYGVCVLNRGMASWPTNVQMIPEHAPNWDDYYI